MLSCGFLHLSRFSDQIFSNSEGKENILPCRIFKISNFWRSPPECGDNGCHQRQILKSVPCIPAEHRSQLK